ncbi:Rne/Rng family ribonuclease [Cognatishimia sp. F0-27]|uniref:Rne/Rng family ribonuclease n=1 Tax=Cognatishimia sp. F0-27 TaxID=2816855 RepID=UPI001D0C2AA2|nr:Rne/Rng family ribonuclease [Cognatishimia sp. F0-27]MCC1491614.1 Rne/Rng family ribonuclease [Cognatishimia sp. F0-27]
MAKKMLIDATHAEETRVVVVDGNKVEEFDFESENKRQLAGNIYLAKVTRVEPSLQAAFVDYGGNRHGFLAFSEIHPDYYQIPIADRQALMAEEEALAKAAAEEDEQPKRTSRSRSRRRAPKAETTNAKDAVATAEPETEISGMETIDLSEDDTGLSDEGSSPMERVAETPVEEPQDDQADDARTETASDATDVAETETGAAEAETSASEAAPAQADGAQEDDASTADAESADHTAEQSADTAEEAGGDSDDADSDESADDDDAEPARRPRRGRRGKAEAVERDESIESVADDDAEEDIRPPRKQRARKYKIQEVVKVRQILLVQVVKEERGNKGAALTTYLSLAGRYCVLMPNTARGGGISRKITSATDRSKLKAIASEIDVPKGAGLIIRTAGAKRTKTEIKRDYEYLQRLWEQIRELTLKSIAPAKIYEEGDLIKRSIRDLYNREIDEVLVEGERGYRIAKDFMKMIMPSHAKNVQNYTDPLPLFARYQVESYLGGMFNPTVQLKSGGYIVIGVTEALVAIDVNSGRATKEGSIEETALKTNLEAAEEVARQLRLRDLAGLIVIDFIDMDERKNNAAVEKRIKDKLKTDRARIQVGRISGFGLMEMSRQRLRPGMIEATTQPCSACHGTGLIRSDDNMALQVLRQIEEEGTRRRSREVLVKCPVSIANYLMNQKREHVAQIEARYGMAVRIEGDPHLVAPDFSMEKFKTATRPVPEAAPVVSVDTSLMDQVDEDAAAEAASEDIEVEAAQPAEEAPAPIADDEEKPKKKRRRRRRRGKSRDENGEARDDQDGSETSSDAKTEAAETPPADASEPETDGVAPVAEVAEPVTDQADSVSEDAQADAAGTEEKPKPKRRTRTRTRKPKAEAAPDGDAAEAVAEPADATPDAAPAADAKDAAAAADAKDDAPAESDEEAPKKPRRSRSRKPAKPDAAAVDEPATPEPAAQAEPAAPAEAKAPEEPSVETVEQPAEEPASAPAPAAEETPKPKRTRRKASEVIASVVAAGTDVQVAEPAVAPEVSEPEPEAEPETTAQTAADDATDDSKPKKRGWWSLGR